MLGKEQATLCLGATFGFHRAFDHGAFNHIIRNYQIAIDAVQPSEPFKAGHFIVVSISLFPFSAYGFDCLRVSISRIGCLTVVAQQWAHALKLNLNKRKV